MRISQTIRTIFILFLLFTGIEVISQPSINTRDIDSVGRMNIAAFITYYSDTAILKIDSINKIEAILWQISQSREGLNMGIRNQIYWFKFRILNSGSNSSKHYLLLNNKGINEIELFRKSGNTIESLGKTGDHYNFNQRPYPSGNFIYPLVVESKNTVTYYLFCNKRNENLNFVVHVVTEHQLQQREKNIQLYMGLFIGILILGFIISLFLFYIFKEKLPFWYSIYILAVINRILTFEGFDFQYFYPTHPFYADISRYMASSILLALFTYIMQIYCNQQANNSRFYHATNALRWSVIIFIPATLIIYQYFPNFTLKRLHFVLFIFMQTIGVIILAISCFEKILQRFKPAGFYFIAVVLLLFSGIQAILQEIGIINHSFETPNLIQWSFILEVILIIVGILYRYNLIKQENESLFLELNEQKLTSIKQILDIQQKEQQRIAEDLHDILGGQMAVLKIKISALKEVNEKKEKLIELIDEVVLSTRNIAHNLIPIQLNNNAISDIVSSYLVRLNNIQPIHFNFLQIGQPIGFSKEVELDLYKILMEIIQNIIKHSEATEASIQFFFTEQQFEIVVEDNGIGMDTQSQKGMGIKNIYKRVANLNGNLHIDSVKGTTTFIITIPILNE